MKDEQKEAEMKLQLRDQFRVMQDAFDESVKFTPLELLHVLPERAQDNKE